MLPADFSRLGDECMALEKAGVDRIQWDVMDGRFVPNLTFGPDVIASIRPHVDVMFEAHLMVEKPDELAHRYADGSHDPSVDEVAAALRKSKSTEGGNVSTYGPGGEQVFSAGSVGGGGGDACVWRKSELKLTCLGIGLPLGGGG